MTLRLFLRVASLEARAKLGYRVDFWITSVVTVLIELGLYYFICLALFPGHGGPIGGFSLDGLLLYYLAAVLVGKIVRGSEFEGTISADIYDGGLNRYLVFPTAYLPFKLAQQLGALAPVFVQTMVLSGAVAACFDLPADVAPTVGTVAMAIVAMAIAALLYFLMGYPIHSVAFWADNVWSLSVSLRLAAGLLGGLMVPLELFPPRSQSLLAWLPFRLLFGFPVETLLGRVSFQAWLAGIALGAVWCSLFALLGRLVFRRGELQYSGVGI